MGGGVSQHDFNRIYNEVAHSVNRFNDHFGNLRTQLFNNFAQLKNKIDAAFQSVKEIRDDVSGKAAILGNQMNDNINRLENKVINAVSVSANQMKENVNSKVVSLESQLNDNFAQLGTKVVNTASLSVKQVNANAANLGNQLNENMARIGNQLNENSNKLGNEVADEFDTVAVALGSIFDHLKIIIVLLTIFLVLMLLRFAILRCYRFCKIDRNRRMKVQQDIGYKTSFSMGVSDMSQQLGAFNDIDIERIGKLGQAEHPKRGWVVPYSNQSMAYWGCLLNRFQQQYDKQFLPLARRIQLNEMELSEEPLIHTHCTAV